MKLILTYTGLFFVLLILATPANADNDETAAYKRESLRLVPLNESTREQHARKLLYETKSKPVKIRRKDLKEAPKMPSIDPTTFDDLLYYLLLFLVLLVLCYVLFRYMAGDAPLFQQAVKRQKNLQLSDIESNLKAVDVDQFLRQSLQDKDYRLSIRLYYLAIIKKLSELQVIDWAKDKTNGHYLREMRSVQHPSYIDFKNLTRVFEYVWYSDVRFDQGQFKEVSVDFKKFLQTIDKQ